LKPKPLSTTRFAQPQPLPPLLFLAAKFPHRQFNSAELCVLSGIGRTAFSEEGSEGFEPPR
jgi:hypothetical protein